MSNKTLVPDKLHGYLLQVIHMLYELISVDDRVVSIEKLDDVAVEIDGRVIAEQLKSVTSANNPIADRASVFWKTLYNWCTYIEDGSLPPNAILRFVVVSNSTVTPGSIQKIFMDAHTDDEAQRALIYAKETILHTSTEDSDNVRFLYKGIIINHNKKLSQPTLKRRFFKKKAAFFSWPGLGKEWC